MAVILLVEDNEDVRKLLCRAIEDTGHDVLSVSNFADADREFSSGKYDLLICDVRLPDGSGSDLAAKAAAAGKKALVITGHPDTIQGLERQNRPYLRKPFRIQEFVHLIDQHLRTSEPPIR